MSLSGNFHGPDEVVATTAKGAQEYHVPYQPPYRPELNPVERMWAYLKSYYLSNRVFIDYDDLFDGSRQAWNTLTQADLQSICHTE